MAIILKANEVERVHIPAKLYKHATLVGVRPQQFPDYDDPTKMKDHLIWAFEIPRKGGPVTVEAITSTAFGGKSTARKFAKALMAGQEPPATMDIEELYGHVCQVKVDDKTKDGETYSRITDVFAPDLDEDEDEEPAPAKSPAAKAPAKKQPAAEDEDGIPF